MPWSGRLEVYANGEWGTVCDRSFTQKEANIACRALGYGSAKSVLRQATYGRGTGKIHYTNLKLVYDLNNNNKYYGEVRIYYRIIYFVPKIEKSAMVLLH